MACSATIRTGEYLPAAVATTFLPLGSDFSTSLLPDQSLWQYDNWGGTGVDMLLKRGGSTNYQTTAVGLSGVSGAGRSGHFHLALSRPMYLRSMYLGDFDGPTGELMWDMDPPVDAVPSNFRNNQCTNNSGGSGRRQQAQGHVNRGCIRSIAANQNGTILWNYRKVTSISFSMSAPAGLNISFGNIGVLSTNPYVPASFIKPCTGTPVWRDQLPWEVLTATQIASIRNIT